MHAMSAPALAGLLCAGVVALERVRGVGLMLAYAGSGSGPQSLRVFIRVCVCIVSVCAFVYRTHITWVPIGHAYLTHTGVTLISDIHTHIHTHTHTHKGV
jgi:hypothetical protein